MTLRWNSMDSSMTVLQAVSQYVFVAANNKCNFSSRFFERLSSWLVASKDLVATNHGQLCHAAMLHFFSVFWAESQEPNSNKNHGLEDIPRVMRWEILMGQARWKSRRSNLFTSVTRICGGHCLYCRRLSLPSYTQAAAPGRTRWEYAQKIFVDVAKGVKECDGCQFQIEFMKFGVMRPVGGGRPPWHESTWMTFNWFSRLVHVWLLFTRPYLTSGYMIFPFLGGLNFYSEARRGKANCPTNLP